MPDVHPMHTSEEAAVVAAAFVAKLADERGSAAGRFTIALSPGHHPVVREQGCCKIPEDEIMGRR